MELGDKKVNAGKYCPEDNDCFKKFYKIPSHFFKKAFLGAISIIRVWIHELKDYLKGVIALQVGGW